MRIAFVLSHCHHYGSSKNVLEISKYLSKWGHEIHVFANTCDKVNFLKFHKIPSLTSNFFISNASISFFETLRMKLEKFDVTVAQPGRYFTPKVCHVRFLTKTMMKINREKLYSKIFIEAEKYTLKKCKHIIAMSNLIKKFLIEDYNIQEEKISVVYDGVDINLFSPKNRRKYSKEIREYHNIDKEEKILLFVGNPFSRKGLCYLVKSLPLIKSNNYRVIILGRSLPQDPIEKYISLAKSLGVEEKILYCGFSKEVHKYFASSDIFVLPTLYEPFGLVILEAMASGLPVIIPKNAGAAELIEDGKEGLLLNNPRDFNEIAEKINYLIENEKEMKRMRRAARKKAEKYPWERTAKEMLEVFEFVTRKE